MATRSISFTVPVANQVAVDPGIGQFHEFESPRWHTRIISLAIILVPQSTSGKRESVPVNNNRRNIDKEWGC